MNCSVHTEAQAVAFCRACGKALCADCRRDAGSTVYCAEHVPDPGAPQPAQPYRPAAPPRIDNHPALAFILGFIPGVGAIYNGQYAKGLVHAIVFGLFISILDSDASRGFQPLVAIMMAVFVLYMPFEAYHTARRKSAGEAVDEFSSLLQPRQRHSSAGAVTLIVLGAVFLLNTLDIVEMHQILRFWPVLLIVLGIAMLQSRISEAARSRPAAGEPDREVNHEQQ